MSTSADLIVELLAKTSWEQKQTMWGKLGERFSAIFRCSLFPMRKIPFSAGKTASAASLWPQPLFTSRFFLLIVFIRRFFAEQL